MAAGAPYPQLVHHDGDPVQPLAQRLTTLRELGVEGVLTRGEATWSDDQLLVLSRGGYPEECYFTFSYSPIRDEDGAVCGVFCAVHETTERVLGERRLRTLAELAERTTDARTAREARAPALPKRAVTERRTARSQPRDFTDSFPA